MRRSRTRLPGITLIEVIIVTAILGLLMVTLLVSIRSYLTRSQDARRKSDLKKISQALEQYYNDYGGYPGSLSSVLTTPPNYTACGANTVLEPYLKVVPCDPNGGSERPYLYIRSGFPRASSRAGSPAVYPGYRLLTALTYKADPTIKESGCTQAEGCRGIPDGTVPKPQLYNWGLAANDTVQK